MRQLILTRGSMGSGKSTWIKENGLEQFTLSADDIRLLFQSPVMNESGNYTINARHDGKVWKFLFELLEERMKRGEFTVVDATHAKAEMISQYKKLAQTYRYRVTVVDFSDVPLETLLEQNKMRPEYKHVPEQSIRNSHQRMTTEKVPSWVTVIKPHEFQEAVNIPPVDFSMWKKIHHIGDIHGCYSALMEYLNGGLKDDELYIFVGDLLDRGIENAEVLTFFLKIYKKPNVIILEGNHERWIWMWANDEVENIRNQGFITDTMPELDAVDFDKKEVRQLYRRLRQLVYYTYHEKVVVVTHGGIARKPDNFMYMATEQLVNGVGDYETDIDYAWESNEIATITGAFIDPQNPVRHICTYQIHGHRNIFRLPVQAGENSFNLEGQVEKGGHLRAVTLTEDGFETHEVKNNVFLIRKGDAPVIDENDMDINEFIDYLINHKEINQKPLGDNIYSFNFSRKAFADKIWDDINIKARGLFINKNTKEIVSRSYNKFFNINERSSTKIGKLADTLKFPVRVYDKPNGYLGTVGFNSEKDELVFTSKSDIHTDHALWLKELFYKQFNEDQRESIKHFLKSNNDSLVFEVILIEKDPHIIEYKEDKLVLLDIVKRDVVYKKAPYEIVRLFGDIFNVETKKLEYTFYNWTDFYKWYRDVVQDWSLKKEGYVIEDSNGFMTKLKLPYYNFWKQMRGLKDKFIKRHEHMVKGGSLYTPLHNQVFAWMKEQDPKWLKETDIITIRKKFLNSI